MSTANADRPRVMGRQYWDDKPTQLEEGKSNDRRRKGAQKQDVDFGVLEKDEQQEHCTSRRRKKNGETGLGKGKKAIANK